MKPVALGIVFGLIAALVIGNVTAAEVLPRAIAAVAGGVAAFVIVGGGLVLMAWLATRHRGYWR